jgi:hypothetical protein
MYLCYKDIYPNSAQESVVLVRLIFRQIANMTYNTNKRSHAGNRCTAPWPAAQPTSAFDQGRQ